MAEAVIQNFDVDLSVVKTTALQGPTGNAVAAVYPTPASAGAQSIPAGASIQIQFGNADPIWLDGSIFGFEFECGHDKGIKVHNHSALTGVMLRLSVVYRAGGSLV